MHYKFNTTQEFKAFLTDAIFSYVIETYYCNDPHALKNVREFVEENYIFLYNHCKLLWSGD